jgi:hypothetical protein
MSSEHEIQEAIGPPLSPREAVGAIGLGVVSLIFAGVIPVLLGGLADEGRISSAGIGYCAGLEGLSMALTTAFAGILLKSRNLKWLGAIASVVLTIVNLATTQTSGSGVFAMRIAAGIPEGLLLWLTVSMIARSEVPERWAGLFFTALVGGQLALALALWGFVMNWWGANGGFAAMALSTATGLIFAFLAPDSYAPLPKPEGESGSPPLRGWVALLGTLFFAGTAGAVGTFLQPLAHQAGLSADVARTALWVSLVAQVVGGATATALGGRVHYMSVFVFTTICFLMAFAVFGFSVPAWAFVAANTLAGFVTILLGPFLVPMTIEADPSRRAAVLSASTQVLAGALAPFCAAMLVRGNDVRGVLFFGSAILLIGLAIFALLHALTRRLAKG